MIQKKIMYTLKQKKYSNLINYYLNKLFILESKNKFYLKNKLITVIYVYINKIFSYSNIYITIYPNKDKSKIKKFLNINCKYYKKKISYLLKNKFKIPKIKFFLYN